MEALKESQDKLVEQADKDRGIIIVNTGDGKGKSTAGFGTIIRALGQGLKVALVQFIKGPWETGEIKFFKKQENLQFFSCGEGFTWETQNKELDIKAAQKGWEYVKNIIQDETSDIKLLVLDEFNLILHYGYLDNKEVISILKNKNDNLNIIITGRNAPSDLIEIADTVTEMKLIKHAFQSGIKSQKGIEF